MAQRTTEERRFGPRARTPRSGAILAVGLMLAGALLTAGCSSDDGKQPDRETTSAHASEVTTDARLGRMRGKLADAKRSAVLDDVTALVEKWSDAAYTGSASTDPKGAFAAFTRDARALAGKQTALSNLKAGDVGDAALTQRVVRVDIVSARGKAIGATARIRLDVDLPGLDRTDQVRGRLLLTPVKGAWKVFGFDVDRSEGAS